ncbi:MAG: S8 family peptidase [Candidatus Heimdallarchaeaceae archaeon]
MNKTKTMFLISTLFVSLFFIISLQTIDVTASDPAGTVTINSPSGNDEVEYFNLFTVDFEVERNIPWLYTGAYIYISGVLVTTTGSDDYTGNFYPEAYAGTHTVQIKAHFINRFLETEEVDAYAYFVVTTTGDMTNIEDLRIDELQDYESGKGYLDGSGITICIIDDLLGADDDHDGFHKSMIRSGKNDIYENPDRKYIDIKYYKDTDSDGVFEEEWDVETPTKEEKWQEIFDEGEANYNETEDVHGTYCFAALRHVAPGADFMFIETEDNLLIADDAIKWLHDSANYNTLGIDIISMSFSGVISWSDEIEDMCDDGVIFVNSAGNAGVEMTGTGSAYYPACLDTTIGVTGVTNSNFPTPSERWEKEDGVNWGYGIDIACISYLTTLDWEPVIGQDEFGGTSNAAPIVAGVIALVEQYQDNYEPGTDLTVSLVQTLFKETGDAPESAPDEQGTSISGYYKSVSTSYPTFPYTISTSLYETYFYGWGILDGYELWKYFKLNY